MNKLVTCIFLKFYGTDKGGRPGTWKERYFQGVSHLNNNSYQKIIYTDQDTKPVLESYIDRVCSAEQKQLYDIKVYDIDDCRHSHELTRIKQESGDYGPKDRCVHVQWGKFHFLDLEAADAEQLYWVDAGLISSTLFPKSVFPDNASDVITDAFLNKLKEQIADKVYITVGDRHNGFNGPGDRQRKYHPVGGFFGGTSSSVMRMIDRIDRIQRKYIEKVKPMFEEVLMEDDFYHSQDDYSYEVFDSWYHEDHMLKDQAAAKNIKYWYTFK